MHKLESHHKLLIVVVCLLVITLTSSFASLNHVKPTNFGSPFHFIIYAALLAIAYILVTEILYVISRFREVRSR